MCLWFIFASKNTVWLTFPCCSISWIHCFPVNFETGLRMMTSSNGNIFRVTGPLCGEFTGPGEFPTQRPVTRSFDVFFDLRLNKRLRKQPWGWWFETPSWSSWRHCNEICSCPLHLLSVSYMSWNDKPILNSTFMFAWNKLKLKHDLNVNWMNLCDKKWRDKSYFRFCIWMECNWLNYIWKSQ